MSDLTALQYAIDQNLAPIITYSFAAWEQDFISLHPIAQQANAQAIRWMTGAGDWGAATCDAFYSSIPLPSLATAGI